MIETVSESNTASHGATMLVGTQAIPQNLDPRDFRCKVRYRRADRATGDFVEPIDSSVASVHLVGKALDARVILRHEREAGYSDAEFAQIRETAKRKWRQIFGSEHDFDSAQKPPNCLEAQQVRARMALGIEL